MCATLRLFESKRGGLSYRRREQQQPNIGQNECGIATTNAGCSHREKERRRPGAEVLKRIRNGARDALKIWTRGGWADQQHGHGVRTSSSKKGRVEKRQGNG